MWVVFITDSPMRPPLMRDEGEGVKFLECQKPECTRLGLSLQKTQLAACSCLKMMSSEQWLPHGPSNSSGINKCSVCCLSCFLPHFQHLAISKKFPTLWASSPPWWKTETLTSQPSLQLRYQHVTCFYQSDSPGEMRLRKDALSSEWLQTLSFRVKSWCRNVLEELLQWIFGGINPGNLASSQVCQPLN